MARLDQDGDLMLFKHYPGENSNSSREDKIFALYGGKDGMIYMSGNIIRTLEFGNLGQINPMPFDGQNGFIAAMDTSGQEIWFEPILSCCTIFNQLEGDEKNTLYVAGRFSEYIFVQGDSTEIGNTVKSILLKFDSSGKHLWNKHVKGNTINYNYAMDYADGGAYMLGYSRFGSPTTVKIYAGTDTFSSIGREIEFMFRMEGDTANPNSLLPVSKSAFVLYPNPATNRFSIQTKDLAIETMILYDLKGSKLKKWHTPADWYELPALADGIYMIRIQSGDMVQSELIQILH